MVEKIIVCNAYGWFVQDPPEGKNSKSEECDNCRKSYKQTASKVEKYNPNDKRYN